MSFWIAVNAVLTISVSKAKHLHCISSITFAYLNAQTRYRFWILQGGFPQGILLFQLQQETELIDQFDWKSHDLVSVLLQVPDKDRKI